MAMLHVNVPNLYTTGAWATPERVYTTEAFTKRVCTTGGKLQLDPRFRNFLKYKFDHVKWHMLINKINKN